MAHPCGWPVGEPGKEWVGSESIFCSLSFEAWNPDARVGPSGGSRASCAAILESKAQIWDHFPAEAVYSYEVRGFNILREIKKENCMNYIHRQNKTALLKNLLQLKLYFLELYRGDVFP